MSELKNRQGFSTRAIHAGQKPDPTTGAVMTPIYATSTYAQESPGVNKGYEYARGKNPTREAFEACIADLEGGTHGFGFASGMAATSTALELLDAGDHVVTGDDLYGGSWRLFERVRRRSMGLDFAYVDLSDIAAVEAAITPKTRMLWVETPTNPMMKLADIAALSQIARARGLILVVDNTFATPVCQQPLGLGADIVMHSATKYLNGHSDIIAGALVGARDDAHWAKLRAIRAQLGTILGQTEAWLLMRGMRTLFPRVAWACRSAQALAEKFAGHPMVAEVLYPGLPSFAGHAAAARQMKGGFGGMLSVRVKGGERAAIATAARVELWKRATSLGGVESLIEHRASIEGAGTPCPPDLLRLSVGVEEANDLFNDLDQALKRAHNA